MEHARLKVSCTLWLLLISLFVNAQGHYPVIAMQVDATPISGYIVNGIVNLSDTTLYQAEMHLIISDTVSVNQLQVVLKNEVGGTSLLLKTFTYDVFGSLGDGTTYYRNGYEIILGLGNFPGLFHPYAELIVVTSSSTTDPIIFY